jgi:hypothetical protein
MGPERAFEVDVDLLCIVAGVASGGPEGGHDVEEGVAEVGSGLYVKLGFVGSLAGKLEATQGGDSDIEALVEGGFDDIGSSIGGTEEDSFVEGSHR